MTVHFSQTPERAGGGGRALRGDLAVPTPGAEAAAHGASEFQVALAWLLARSPAMLPIPGTSSVDHLDENVAAAALRLSDEEVAELG